MNPNYCILVYPICIMAQLGGATGVFTPFSAYFAPPPRPPSSAPLIKVLGKTQQLTRNFTYSTIKPNSGILSQHFRRPPPLRNALVTPLCVLIYTSLYE